MRLGLPALTDIKTLQFFEKLGVFQASGVGQADYIVILAAEEQQRRSMLATIQRFDRAHDQQMVSNIFYSFNTAVDPCNRIVQQWLT